MFERFTDKARQSIAFAQHEARALGHNFIGTEHQLLGMLALGDGVAFRVLAAEGVTLEQTRQTVVEWIGRGPQDRTVADAEALATIGIDLDEVKAAVEDAFGPGALELSAARRHVGRFRGSLGAPPFAPRAKKLLELSLREALALKHSSIGTEHLLLAMLRLGEGVGYEVLAERVDPAELRTKVIDELARYRPGA
jgi:ATP-dependent Clp protease ATP-binding subunit ClpA